MALKTIVWCDGCKEQQYGGSPAFEVTISRRQILPTRSSAEEKRTFILCGYQCDDPFWEALEKLIAAQVKTEDPRVQLQFGRKAKTGGQR